MPINIQNLLPAKNALEAENIFVMTKDRAIKQDIRPLKILILNLMPNKIETETQLLRLLSNTPLQIDIDFLQVQSHKSKNTSASHINTFYKTLKDIYNENFDGMIVTGAPVEQMEFKKVDYFDEFCEILNWSKQHVYSSFYICWSAQAALYHFFGIPKYKLNEKLSGIFRHRVLDIFHPLMRGFDDRFLMPHSRNTELKREDIEKCSELNIIATSSTAGIAIIANKNGRQFFVTGHAEYDRNTLANEYFRDSSRLSNAKIPINYFPSDDPTARPTLTWRSHANLLFSNWLNYYVYQRTPYNIKEIKE